MKYRKKPVIIEAIKLIDGKSVDEMREVWGIDFVDVSEFDWTCNEMTIRTLEGRMKAIIGDFIIKGIKGEFYPCKSDIFEATYEPVTP